MAQSGEWLMLNARHGIVPILVLVFSALVRTAVAQAPPDTARIIYDARSAFDRGDWRAAINFARHAADQSPQNSEFRLMLARAEFSAGDYTASLADYRKARDLNAFDIPAIDYKIAKIYALQKKNDLAMQWLKSSIAGGYRLLEDARSDAAFAAFRENAEYRLLLGLVDPSSMSREDGWRYDIRFLADWVGKKSFHPFHTETGDRVVSSAVSTRGEFEARVGTLLTNVPKLTDGEIEVALFKLVATLGDGHTILAGSRRRSEFAVSFPLAFYIFDDGVYVVSAAQQYRDLVGARIIAIDGMPIESALQKLDPLISRDNAMWVRTMEPLFLRHVPLLQTLGITHGDKGADFDVRLRDGSRKTVHVEADMTAPDIWNMLPKPADWVWIADSSSNDFQTGNDKFYWWRWNPDDRILYVQYNKVADSGKQTLKDFAGELAAAIAKYPVEKLVIDMRNNNGGDTFLNEPLLETVAASPTVNRKGHLYVIIGRRTFSAAMNAVSYFGRFTQALFVGEPTGGKPNAPGDETFFTLPYSGIAVNLSDRYWQSSWPDDFSNWRAPDIATPVTFSDYARGRDAAMDAIRAQRLPQ